MFEHCALLRPYLAEHSIDEIFASFTHYKTRVPVCGAILLNTALDKCLLVKGWHSRSSWGFPKGKINKDEPELECAKREVPSHTRHLNSCGATTTATLRLGRACEFLKNNALALVRAG